MDHIKMPNPNTIPCRRCKWGKICFFLDKSCTQYASKPNNIYYDSEPCPKFVLAMSERINQNNIKLINDDALNTDADILLHQVNLQGVMGGGIAKQIATTYPIVEKEYREYKDKKLGNVLFVKTEKYIVGNCFSQTMDFNTDYNALELCLDKTVEYMKENGLKSIAIPYKYGCGIANGDWDKVLSIFENKIKDYNLKIYKL